MSSVDVIVPCYRYGHFLRECVRSVLTQSGPDVRVLILDDASPDNTAEVATELTQEDSRVTFWRHNANKGHITTYNEGIEWASSDYLLLLSADDYLLPGALSRATGIMDMHREVGFVFGSVVELSDSGTTTQITTVPNELLGKADQRILAGLQFIKLSGSRNFVATPTAVVRAELQKRVGGYRPQLPHAGDMEMWLRLAAHASVGVVRACQAVWRRHSDNMSHAYYRRNRFLELHEKKAVLDWFIEGCRYRLMNADNLHREMLWSLGCEAIGCASAAFNDGDMMLSDQISEFALSVCTDLKRSWPWAKLAWKRQMGLGAWRALEPTVAKLRKLTLVVKDLSS